MLRSGLAHRQQQAELVPAFFTSKFIDRHNPLAPSPDLSLLPNVRQILRYQHRSLAEFIPQPFSCQTGTVCWRESGRSPTIGLKEADPRG
jgi:hypothetical protein